ncbi:MAG: glycoside hydrolase family 9 protein [Ruminococcus sp.]
MKSFQSIIQKYLKNHKNHKKYIAVVLSLSILVSFVVPLSLMMPATSMTNIDDDPAINVTPLSALSESREVLENAAKSDAHIFTYVVDGQSNQIAYSPKDMELITLLFGAGESLSWLNNCTTVEEAMSAAQSEYFLGFASDFCAFIENDFTATEADAEGRVAVGGNLSFLKNWNYQIGSGDYATMTALIETDNYDGISGFASALVGGKMFRVNTLSTGYGHDRNGSDDWNISDRNTKDAGYHSVNSDQYSYTVYYLPEEGLYKRFIVGNIDDSEHYSEDGYDKPYSTGCSHDYPGNCGTNCEHEYLADINELAQMYQYDGVKDIISSAFADVRSRSASLSKMGGIQVSGNGSITLRVPDGMENAKNIYFDLGDSWNGYTDIRFENVPDGANIVVNCGAVNVDIGGNVATYINDERISNSGVQGDVASNNNKASERILYNFYNATDVTINGNFNGTVLAPNADVTSRDDQCPGHLSGALIAKSFYGGLEFGYRPYRGGSEILGLTSGYSVPVDKLIADKNTFLSGANLSVKRVTVGENSNPVEEAIFSWTSNDKTRFVPLPSKIDFSGNTVYTTIDIDSDPSLWYETFEQQFVIYEEKAPEGFIGTNNSYTVDVTEQLDRTNLIVEGDNKTFPQHVKTLIQIKKTEGGVETSIGSWSLDIVDEYGDNGVEARCITVFDASGEGETELVSFRMVVNANAQKVTSITRKDADGNYTLSVLDDLSKASEFTVTPDATQRYYFNPDVMMIMPLPSGNNLEFENTPGLLFKKVDDAGHDVTGATIELYKVGTDEPISDTTIWNWVSDSSSSQLIDVSKLETGAEYIIRETAAPDKYKKAADIHFRKKSETEIEYWSGSSDPTQLDLTKNREIRMTDERIWGAELTLKKVDSEDNTTELSGAKFSLYTKDGTLVCSGLDGNGNIFENAAFKALNNSYAQNGYLKPGVYYLTEDVIPDHANKDNGDRYANPGKIYFTVKSDFTVESGILSLTMPLQIERDSNHIWVLDSDGKKLDDYPSPVGCIPNVKSFIVKTDGTFEQFYATDYADESGSVTEVSHTYETPVDFNNCKIQCWSSALPNITYVEIVTADGIKYVYGSNGSESGDDPETGNTDQNPVLTVNGSTLQIANKLESETKDITVKKNWKGDEGFESLRPESVTVQLYQSTVELTNPKTQLTDDMKSGDPVSLNESNGWTYTWEGLLSYVKDESGKKIPYYYYVKETAVSGYTDSYSVEGDGTLAVTNTLDTIDINAEKTWDSNDVPESLIPATLAVKLQWKVNGEWEDVPGRTLVLKKNTGWTGKFENLPSGKTYRMIESAVPNGWKIKTESNEVSANGGTLSIENEPDLGSLQIIKEWVNDAANKRPDSIKVALYRAIKTLWPDGQSADSVQEDYARLLQYSLYFYDGNMCGDQVDENSAYSWRNDCHTEDAVPGGFHDAGDHVVFGLPAGFTASNLGWSLYEYRDDYDTLGQTAHTKVITDYYADFFYRSVKLDSDGKVSELLVQKGHGNTDHAYWGIPELQDQRKASEMYWRSNTGSDIAAEYAAALALSYLNFHETDEAKYAEYLDMAKKLYEYSERVNSALNESGVNIDELDTSEYPGYYKSDDYKDDQAWAAAWLAIASQKAGNDGEYNTYKSKCQSLLNGGMYDWGGYHWNNVKYGASLVNAAYLGGDWGTVTGFINTNCTGNNYLVQNEWGCARYNTGYQTIALAAANHSESGVNVDNVKTWCKNQMNFILGDNDYSTCFVTNFAVNSTKKPHYRAGCGTRYDMTVKDDKSIIDGYNQDVNRLIGGLVGGPAGNGGSYADVRSDFQKNEVATDYNANLVGAAAGLYHFYKTGQTYEIPGVRKQYLQSQTTQIFALARMSVVNLLANETYNITQIAWSDDGSNTGLTVDKITFYYADNSKEEKTNVTYSGGNWWYPFDLSGLTLENVIGVSIELGGSGSRKLYIQNGNNSNIFGTPQWVNAGSTYSFGTIPSYICITPESDNLHVGDGSTTLVITDNNSDIVSWEIKDADGNTVTDSGISITGNTLTAGNKAGTFTIVGTDNTGKTGSFKITVSYTSFNLSCDKDRMRIGDTATLTCDGTNVQYSVSDDSIAEIADNIVTAKSLGSVTITAKAEDGGTRTVDLEIIGDFTIVRILGDQTQYESALMGLNSVIQLTPRNNIGTVTWALADDSPTDIVEVDSTGNVRSNGTSGTATIVATDSYDNTTAQFIITVQNIGIEPDLPTGAEFVQYIELDSKGNWSAIVNNLPYTNESGDTYYYYIAECDEKGNFVTTINGNGAKYIPVEYVNGLALSKDEANMIQLSVTNKMTEELQGSMPSTGGEGTTWYYITGMIIILSSTAAYILIRRRRKSAVK